MKIKLVSNRNEAEWGAMETKLLRELCVEIVDCPHSTPSWTSAGKIVIRNFNIQHGKIDFSVDVL